MSLIIHEPGDAGLEIRLTVDEVLFHRQTEYQDVLIGETEAFGRGLFIDGSPQSFASDEGVYHASLVQPAMFSHPAPRRVLVAGGGEGATLREVLRHPTVESAVMVDIDRELVEACRIHLPKWSAGAFEDPRTRLIHANVFHWLVEVEPGSFDVIVLDLGDPTEDNPSQLAFTTEFYSLVERALAPGGVVVTQACELDLAATHDFRSVRSTIGSVFGHTVPYTAMIPSFFSIWGFLLAARSPLPSTPPDLEARWRAAGGETWKHYDPAGHAALLYLPPGLRRRLDRQGQVATAAAPLTVYDGSGHPMDEIEDAQ